MTKPLDVSIYAVYHQETPPSFKSSIIKPLHVGTSTKAREGLSDDTEVNISSKNGLYAELTGQYWMVKNQKHSYIGLCHYRRYFCFSAYLGLALRDFYYLTMRKGIDASKWSSKAISKCGLMDDNKILESLEGIDIILPIKMRLFSQKFPYLRCTIKEQFEANHKPEDFKRAMEVVNRLYPEDKDIVAKAIAEKSEYLWNMFIMRYDIFIDYSNWLFNILEEYERTYNPENKDRVLGMLGERLLNIYIYKLKQTSKVKIKELPVLFLGNQPKSVPD